MNFSPKCILFICNKLDTIPPFEGNGVLTHIIKNLSQSFPDIAANTQIFRLSTTKALAAQNFGVMNSEFSSLVEKIGCLVTKASKQDLNNIGSSLNNF